jgi:alkanesulfonate monooxygenase SsuD/methylene tetrahydromethanopterin reductase-like flavin-dependent oxidoreductase (luciferase family)
MLTPTPDGWATLAQRAEDLGYSTLLTADHLGVASALAPLVAAAGVTRRLRFGTLVLNNDFHRPLRLAQEAATVDVLTGGRLELGLGSGWNKPEYDLLGLGYDSPAERAARLGDALRTMTRAWAGDEALALGSGERARPAVPPPGSRRTRRSWSAATATPSSGSPPPRPTSSSSPG